MSKTAISEIPITVTPSFGDCLRENSELPLRRAKLKELQINMGKLCNQACNHCHVDAGPKRTEIMSQDTMMNILDWVLQSNIASVDITGGAPELNPGYRQFVETLVQKSVNITSRCNLTVMFEENQSDLPEWFAKNKVRLVCSLPCYSQVNVDAQRGKGVFEKSITALRLLNNMGYGKQDHLKLDLVYNPIGASLPPKQAKLEIDYKQRLWSDFGIVFNHLLTLTNLPISRFQHYLVRTGQEQSYARLLYDNFNPDTLTGLMCRHLLSVDWQGKVYDCDFNQMLEMGLPQNHIKYLWEINIDEMNNQTISVGNHCFGCTAGAGSSCGGVLTA